MTDAPKKPFETIINKDGRLEIILPEVSPEEARERKSISARCGHVKRKLLRREPLTGELLEFALDILGDGDFSNKGERSTALKLKKGKPLNDYELHIMVDVLLLHVKLGV